jgi:methyl-accepting chemotaxis protein
MSTSKKLSEEPIIDISNNIESSRSQPDSEVNIDILSESKPKESTSFFSSVKNLFKKLNYRIIAIIFILLFLGINIFTYLGDSLNYVKNTFSPIFGGIFKSFALSAGNLTKQTVEVSGEGIKGATDIATGTITSGIDVLEGQVDRNSDTQTKQTSSVNDNSQSTNDIQNTPSQQTDTSQQLDTALANAENSVPLPDDATSTTQKSSSNKSGYCYIGEDRGFRSCIKVNENNVCMSGDIFASEALCINPNLRE